jgi:hypothetical protein
MDFKDTGCEIVFWIQVFDYNVLLSFIYVILQIHRHSCVVVCLASFVDGTVRIKLTQI